MNITLAQRMGAGKTDEEKAKLAEKYALNLTSDMIIQAKDKKLSIDEFINVHFADKLADPAFQGLKGTDALFMSMGIVMKDDMAHGIQASTLEELVTAPQRMSAGYGVNSFPPMFDIYIDRLVRSTMQEQSVLNNIINTTLNINEGSYKSVYLDLSNNTDEGKKNKDNIKLKRVSQGAELPESKLIYGELAINLAKYGRAIRASYEFMRRQKLNALSRHLALIIQQIALDEQEDAIYTLLNGDGNKGTEAVDAVIDNSTAGKLANAELIRYFIGYFKRHNTMPNTIIANEDMVASLHELMYDITMERGIAREVRTTFPQFNLSDLQVIYSEQIPEKKLLVYNKDLGVNKIVEIGSSIRETAAFITNQTSVQTISENVGFASVALRTTELAKLKS